MNVSLVMTSYPPATGGAQIHMHQLAQRLAPNNRIQVVTQWDENRTDWLLGTTLNAPGEERTYEIDGIPVQRVTIPREGRLRLLPWVVGYYPLMGLAIPRIASELENVINPWVAGADVIHNCRIGREGISYAAFNLARKMEIPFILTPVHHPRWNGWLYRYYHRLYRQADALIALTEAERRMLVQLGVDERCVFVTGIGPVLTNAFDPRRFRERYSVGDGPLVLFLGQKYPYKGMALILDAALGVWREYPETHFVFIGPRTAYSRRLFAGVHDRRILELDTVDLQEKTDALAACDVLCLPSTQESFGGVYTEAWSMGKPVIGCDIPSTAEVIRDGVDGLLVSPEIPPLADVLLQLLRDPSSGQRMGEAGRAKVQARYTWEKLAALTLDIYKSALR